MIIESSLGMENVILPDTSIVMAIRLKGMVLDKAQTTGDYRLPRYVFSGLRKQPRIINYAQNSATLLVNFKEGGASAFFNIPMHHFFGQNIALENLVSSSELNELSDKLNEVSTDAARIKIIEQFLKDRMNGRKADALIVSAVETIKQTNGNIKISCLANDLNISKDPFAKRFRQHIGASPKQFANIIRLQNSIANYTGNNSLTALALEAGFYDQAHFIHEFKLFTGQTPLNYFRSIASAKHIIK